MKRDFDNELRTALCDAMELEYSKYPNAENFNYEYQFSADFERKMEEVCQMAEHVYVSFGRHRLRLLAAVALIAAMLITMTAGAIAGQKLYVKWNEKINAEDGTMDITFNVDDPNQVGGKFKIIKPEAPEGYHIESETQYSATECEIEYADEEGHVIYYSQGGNVAATGLKMDIEADYGEIEVNGYKGYFYKKAGCNSLLWSDGVSLFQIIGNCDMETLKKMVVL